MPSIVINNGRCYVLYPDRKAVEFSRFQANYFEELPTIARNEIQPLRYIDRNQFAGPALIHRTVMVAAALLCYRSTVALYVLIVFGLNSLYVELRRFPPCSTFRESYAFRGTLSVPRTLKREAGHGLR